MEHVVKFEGKEYIINEENLIELLNDEVSEVENFTFETIIELLNIANPEFDKAYYSTSCEACDSNFKEKRNVSEYIEYYFYIYTKDNKFVISSISKEYEGLTYTKLERMGKVDDSYIVTIMICNNCGKSLIQIEELEI